MITLMTVMMLIMNDNEEKSYRLHIQLNRQLTILVFVVHLVIMIIISIIIILVFVVHLIIETLTFNFTSILRRNWKQSGVGSGPRALSSIIKIGIILIFCIFASRFLEIVSLHIRLYQTDLRVTLVREKLRKILSTVGQVIGKSDSHSWSLYSSKL